MSHPSVGRPAVSKVSSKSPASKLDGPGLTSLMEKKFKHTASEGAYMLELADAKKLFDDPAIKGNLTGFVKALLSKDAPSINLEMDSLAELYRRLGGESQKNDQAVVAAYELSKNSALEKDRAVSMEMDRAFVAGEKGTAYTFKDPRESGKPYGGR